MPSLVKPPHLTTAEWDAVHAALAPVNLDAATIAGLVEILGTPAPSGRFTAGAFHAIDRVRARIRTARTNVTALPSSKARPIALAALADLDETFALLAQIGRDTNPARAARLKADLVTVDVKLRRAAAAISPALKVRAKP